MVRNFKKENVRQQWKLSDLQLAVTLAKDTSLETASATFQIPKSTLARYVSSNIQEESCTISKLGRPCLLSSKEEEELVSYLQDMQAVGFGLTATELRQIM